MSKANSQNRLSRKEKEKLFRINNLSLNGETFEPVFIDGVPVHYAVSNFGRVVNTETKRILLPGQNTGGYFSVLLCDKDQGIEKFITVHRLVANAFIPNPDNLPAINHINGNILDCSVENLEWVTHKQNSEHAVLMGLYSMGDNNPVTKIPDQIVRQICYDFQRGKGIKYVAKKYGINKHTAASIKHGNARKHISRDFDLSKAGNDTPHDEDHHLSKINNKTTHAICRDLEAGMSVPAVARKYNTTIGIVEHIKEGNTHWHIARHYNVGNSKPDKFRTIPDEVFFEVVERLKRGETNIAIADAMSDKGISRRYVDNVRNRYIRPDDTKDIVFPTVYKGPLSEETLRKTADLIMDGYSNVEIGKKLADEGMTRQMANAIRTHRAYTDMFRDYDFPETKIKRNVGLDKKRKDEARKKRYAKMMEQIANGGNLVIKLEGVRCNKVRKK